MRGDRSRDGGEGGQGELEREAATLFTRMQNKESLDG